MRFYFLTIRELTRLFASGRISELAGERAIELDIRMRTLGFYRHAQQQAKRLDLDTRRFFQKHLDGVNAFIEKRRKKGNVSKVEMD
jgi:penicillin amidase